MEFCCTDMRDAHSPGTDNEMYGSAVYTYDGETRMGTDLPPIKFCPWCGHKINA